jgi:predicted permease
MLIWNVFTQVLLPILLMFAAGWALDRRWNLDLATVVKLNLNLFVPAFIFYELVTRQLSGAEALKAVGFTVAVVFLLFLLAAIVARLFRYTRAQTRSLQIASGFYNSANYGIPLMALAYPGAQALQVFVILVQNIGNFTIGIFLVSSARTPGWRAALPMLRQTSVWAVAIALTVRGNLRPHPAERSQPGRHALVVGAAAVLPQWVGGRGSGDPGRPTLQNSRHRPPFPGWDRRSYCGCSEARWWPGRWSRFLPLRAKSGRR